MSERQSERPPITITRGDEQRLSALANANAALFPRVTHFLTQELDRADVVSDQFPLLGAVRMGSRVTYRNETTGHVRGDVSRSR